MSFVRFLSLCRSKRGLFKRANWNANTYRWVMCEIVFAVHDLIPDDDNRLCKFFAAFVTVYVMLRKLRHSERDLSELQAKLLLLHKCVEISARCLLIVFCFSSHMHQCEASAVAAGTFISPRGTRRS